MFDALRDRFELARWRRSHRSHNRTYRREIDAAKSTNEKEQLAGESYAVFRDTIEPYLQELETRRTARTAARLGVALPPYPSNIQEGNDTWLYCSYRGRLFLTDEGHWRAWQHIREVRDYRRTWLAVLTGFVGLLVALVSALVSLGLLHRLAP